MKPFLGVITAITFLTATGSADLTAAQRDAATNAGRELVAQTYSFGDLKIGGAVCPISVLPNLPAYKSYVNQSILEQGIDSPEDAQVYRELVYEAVKHAVAILTPPQPKYDQLKNSDVISAPAMPYPPEAAKMNLQGETVLLLTIKDGVLADVKHVEGMTLFDFTLTKWIRENWEFRSDLNGTFIHSFSINPPTSSSNESTNINGAAAKGTNLSHAPPGTGAPAVDPNTGFSPTPTPDTSPVTETDIAPQTDGVATAAFNALQDRLHRPHAPQVWYDRSDDSYHWIGPRTHKPMSMVRHEFNQEIFVQN